MSRGRWRTAGWLAAALATVAGVATAQSAPHAGVRQIVAAEDARGTGVDGVKPLIDGLHSRDTLVRRVAVRAVGRLQQSGLAVQLLPLLHDSVAAIRAEAANALAQAAPPLKGRDPADRRATVDADSIAAALLQETDPAAASIEANALGRLPYGDYASARRAEGAITEHLVIHPDYGGARGLYAIAMGRKLTTGFAPATVAALRQAALHPTVDPLTRRMALLALTTGRAASNETLAAGFNDPDEQVRRLAVAGSRAMDSTARGQLLAGAFHDSSAIVRIEAITSSRIGPGAIDCGPIVAAMRDSVMYVRLMAIDGLGRPCEDVAAAAAALTAVLSQRRSGLPAHAWQEPAHALVALAHVDSAAARPFVASFANAARWEERVYAAHAGALLDDTALLTRLAHDPDHNVVEAAVDGLHATVGHAADATYIAALMTTGNQSIRAAALALRGTSDARAKPALWDVLARLTATRSENSRDPRVGVLQALGDGGGAADSTTLAPYVADFDSAVAQLAATTLSRWTGHSIAAHPVPLAIVPPPALDGFPQAATRITVTLADSSGGGQFVVELFAGEAPATVARIKHLIQQGFYNGHLFHRVEPDFVVQGGGTDASEYAGDATFMRDELTARPHARGTLGISTRGRDTGDAQWFINLVDNPRLDHDYTIFGDIVAGREVAERIEEGDVIAKMALSVQPSTVRRK